MEIKNGKVYVDAAGRKVRVVCTDYKPASAAYAVLGIVEDVSGEMVRAYRADGTNSYAASLVKEYIPPIKVRLIVYRTQTDYTGTLCFGKEDRRFVLDIPALFGVNHKVYTVISDQIIEVEDNSK